jgi:hypothetical protein
MMTPHPIRNLPEQAAPLETSTSGTPTIAASRPVSYTNTAASSKPSLTGR